MHPELQARVDAIKAQIPPERLAAMREAEARILPALDAMIAICGESFRITLTNEEEALLRRIKSGEGAKIFDEFFDRTPERIAKATEGHSLVTIATITEEILADLPESVSLVVNVLLLHGKGLIHANHVTRIMELTKDGLFTIELLDEIARERTPEEIARDREFLR